MSATVEFWRKRAGEALGLAGHFAGEHEEQILVEIACLFNRLAQLQQKQRRDRAAA